MQKRLVTRYATKSAEAADENQRRVEGVFAELEANKPGNVSYIVLRLEDGSFVHVSFHDHRDDEVNPISSTAALISRRRRSSAPTSPRSGSSPDPSRGGLLAHQPR
jgi:predicted SnoaL-like aldol condensation-catalyzing enzyme